MTIDAHVPGKRLTQLYLREREVARLAGKVAIVTGAARGMGASHGRVLAREGARVVVTDLVPPSPDEQLEGASFRYVRHDVTDAASWAEVIAFAEQEFGPVSILVNNAGIVKYAPLEKLDEIDYHHIVGVNQTSVFLGMKAVVPSMRAAGGGSIVNISSAMGLVGTANSLAYVATKFAVTGMTKAAAAELGPMNIRVNSVHPGVVRTPMFTELGDRAGAVENMLLHLPIPRLGRPEEISSLVLHLASDESGFSTGAAFVADGGWTCI